YFRRRSFVGGSVSNAIQVRVGRTGNQAVRLALGTLLGWYSVDVAATATAATQSVQVILVMDITGSWEQRNFVKAREAAMTFLDSLHQNHGPQDMVGMVVFMNRYGWEYTPMTSVEDSFANANLVTNKWAKLNVGSYAGEYQTAWTTGSNLNNIHVPCRVYGNSNNGTRYNPYARVNGTNYVGFCNAVGAVRSTTPSPSPICYQPTRMNNWTVVGAAGGCFPNMPHYYSDEAGTDHTTGMSMAEQMFQDHLDPTAYKAMVVLTDGEPYGYNGNVTIREQTRWTEPFREYKYPGAHYTPEIERDTPVVAQRIYNNLGVNTWFVSFRDDRPFMASSVTGDGWYAHTTNAADIIPIFQEIARSLPVSIVN
ncbi:MAG TPA: hypothetical protein PKW90_03975, partial [Myxococcota bacterium]|nr:hypothetical protein [Myxococcota bacterium]